MAFTHVGQHDSLAGFASEDLTKHQFRAVIRVEDRKIAAAPAGDSAGILENNPKEGAKGNYYATGICPAVAGAAFDIEAKLTTDAQSRMVAAAAGAAYQYRAEEPSTKENMVVSVRRECGAVPAAGV